MKRQRLLRPCTPCWGLLAVLLASSLAFTVVLAESQEANQEGSCSNIEEIDSRVQTRINAAAALAGIADGFTAQIPGAASVLVPTIQAAMVYNIGVQYGCHLTRTNCLSIVYFLSSNHLRHAFLGQVAGFIPGIGNIFRSSVAFMMTKGMGEVAGRALRCGSATDYLQMIASNDTEAPANTDQDGFGSTLFSYANEFLEQGRFGVDEVRVRWNQFFNRKSQAELLEEVENAAGSVTSLLEMLQGYSWDLTVAKAILEALGERHIQEEACSATNLVLSKLFKGPSEDAQELGAGYLEGCLPHTDPSTRGLIAQRALALLAEQRQLPRSLLEKIVELLQLALQIDERQLGQVDPSIATATVHVAREDPKRLLSAAFAAYLKGAAGACNLLTRLFRTKGYEGAARSWASVRRLKQLLKSPTPPGATRCSQELEVSLRSLLTLPQQPLAAESPATLASEKEDWRGKGSQLSSHELSTLSTEEILSKAIVGQQCPMKQLLGHIRSQARGQRRKDAPLVLLLCGPPGAGKTLIARTIAEAIFKRPIKELEGSGQFRTFHMNQFTKQEDSSTFFGPPRGVVGEKGDLPELLKKWPNAVILLDEIEKSHIGFASSLLKVLGEHGASYDPWSAKDIPTTQATFILTCNSAHDEIQEYFFKHMVEEGISPAQHEDFEDFDECASYRKLKDQIAKSFARPRLPSGEANWFNNAAFRSRITELVPFLPFRPEEVKDAVRVFLSQEAETVSKLESSLEFAPLSLAWEPDVVDFFASSYAHKPEEGLRGVRNQVHSAVAEAIEEASSAGLLLPHGGALLRVQPGSNRGIDVLAVEPQRSSFFGSFSSDTDERSSSAGSKNGDGDGDSQEAEGGWFGGTALGSFAFYFPGVQQQWNAVTEGWSEWMQPFEPPTSGNFQTQWEMQTAWKFDQWWSRAWAFLCDWRFGMGLLVTVAVLIALTTPAAPAAMTATATATAGAVGAAGAAGACGSGTGAASAAAAGGFGAYLNGFAVLLGELFPVVPAILGVALTTSVGYYAWTYRGTFYSVVCAFVALFTAYVTYNFLSVVAGVVRWIPLMTRSKSRPSSSSSSSKQ